MWVWPKPHWSEDWQCRSYTAVTGTDNRLTWKRGTTPDAAPMAYVVVIPCFFPFFQVPINCADIHLEGTKESSAKIIPLMWIIFQKTKLFYIVLCRYFLLLNLCMFYCRFVWKLPLTLWKAASIWRTATFVPTAKRGEVTFLSHPVWWYPCRVHTGPNNVAPNEITHATWRDNSGERKSKAPNW